MKVNKCILILLAVVLCLCSAARSDMTNGGFETGDLSGWTYSGTVAAVTDEYARDFLGLLQPPGPPDYTWYPTEGDYFASLWSTDWAGTNVASLSQTFTANAGLVLQFNYFFDFGDIVPYYDTSMATLTWSTGSATLFEHNTPGYELGDDENIGWTTISYILPVNTTYTLAFRVEDYDGTFESILGVDDVSVVPLPSAFLLGSIGLGYASWRLRKQKVAKPQ